MRGRSVTAGGGVSRGVRSDVRLLLVVVLEKGISKDSTASSRLIQVVSQVALLADTHKRSGSGYFETLCQKLPHLSGL